jgi:hypothetical protein
MSTLIISILFLVILLSLVGFIAVLLSSSQSPSPGTTESFSVIGTENNIIKIENTGTSDIHELSFYLDSVKSDVSSPDCTGGIGIGKTCSFAVHNILPGTYELKIVGKTQIERLTIRITSE